MHVSELLILHFIFFSTLVNLPVAKNSYLTFDPSDLDFPKMKPSRTLLGSTLNHPPSFMKIGPRTWEEKRNKQTNRQTDKRTNVARIIVWFYFAVQGKWKVDFLRGSASPPPHFEFASDAYPLEVVSSSSAPSGQPRARHSEVRITGLSCVK